MWAPYMWKQLILYAQVCINTGDMLRVRACICILQCYSIFLSDFFNFVWVGVCVCEREKGKKQEKSEYDRIPVCADEGQRQRKIVSFVSVCVLAVIVPSKHIPLQTTKSLPVLFLAFLALSFSLFSLISSSIFLSHPTSNSCHLSFHLLLLGCISPKR